MGAIPIEKGTRGGGAAGCSIQTPSQYGNAYLSAGGAVGFRVSARRLPGLQRLWIPGLGFLLIGIQAEQCGECECNVGPLENGASGILVFGLAHD